MDKEKSTIQQFIENLSVMALSLFSGYLLAITANSLVLQNRRSLAFFISFLSMIISAAGGFYIVKLIVGLFRNNKEPQA